MLVVSINKDYYCIEVVGELRKGRGEGGEIVSPRPLHHACKKRSALVFCLQRVKQPVSHGAIEDLLSLFGFFTTNS